MSGNSIALTTEDILRPKVKKLLPAEGIDRYNVPHDFNYKHFPEQIYNLIKEAERVKNWEPAYMASVILCIIGTLTGNKFAVQRADHRQALNIFVVLYGDSAAAKSPVFFYLLDHLFKLDRIENKHHKERLKDYNARQAEAKTQNITLEEAAPELKQLIITGFTMEGLKSKMQKNELDPTLLFADELVSVTGGLNKYNGGNDDKAALMGLADGIGWSIATKKDGITGTYTPRLGLMGAVQPAVIKEVFGTKGDGSSYRYHVAISSKDDRMATGEAIPTYLRDGFNTLIDRLVDIPHEFDEYTGDVKPRVITISQQAELLYQSYGEKLTKIVNSERQSYVSSLVKKQRGYCLKIAAIMQVLYYLSHEEGPEVVGERAMTAAIELTDYYISTGIRAHEDVLNPNPAKNLFGAKLAIYEALPDEFKTAQAVEIAKRHGVSERAAKEFIKTQYFKKLSHGNYEKL